MTNKELKNYYFGAYLYVEDGDGYLHAHQYSYPQVEYFEKTEQYWFERCTASSGKTIEMVTDAKELQFDYRIIWRGSEDTVELWFDDEEAAEVLQVEDLKDQGTIHFSLPGGMKKVTVYLPMDATMTIKNFELSGTKEKPGVPAKGEKVLWMGDSITQGFGSFRSAYTYPNIANRTLQYDFINQGIAGYVYDAGSLMKMDGYQPDRIIVAFGTNQFFEEDLSAVSDFYERLQGIYGSEIPVLCITPVWRCDLGREIPKFTEFCDGIKAICRKYPNITVADGFQMIPHEDEYYVDGLHPNKKGCLAFGRALVDFIRKNWSK